MARPSMIVAALLATSALAVPASAAGRASPTLKLASQRPVVVLGEHFRARERVRLLPSSGPAVSVQADRTGAFRVTLAGSAFSRCGGFSLRATGTRGSVATLKIQRPACLPY